MPQQPGNEEADSDPFPFQVIVYFSNIQLDVFVNNPFWLPETSPLT